MFSQTLEFLPFFLFPNCKSSCLAKLILQQRRLIEVSISWAKKVTEPLPGRKNIWLQPRRLYRINPDQRFRELSIILFLFYVCIFIASSVFLLLFLLHRVPLLLIRWQRFFFRLYFIPWCAYNFLCYFSCQLSLLPFSPPLSFSLSPLFLFLSLCDIFALSLFSHSLFISFILSTLKD